MRRAFLIVSVIAAALTAPGAGSAQARPDDAPSTSGCADAKGPSEQAYTRVQLPAGAPIGTTGCVGVRPGAVVRSETGSCTMNFVFRGLEDDRWYVATAGHCILGDGPIGDDAGERVWAPGTGPIAYNNMGNRIGRYRYAILQGAMDFAIIRIDTGITPKAQMCHFGGPTGANHDRPSVPVVLHHYGRGLVTGDTVPARTATALSMRDEHRVIALGAANFGDSGSPVISADGRAIGVLVAIGASAGFDEGLSLVAGNTFITRLGPQLDRAVQMLGVTLVLQEAPRL